MLSRRSFFGFFPLAVVAASADASQKSALRAPYSDLEHEVGIWRVRWMDWRIPPNQHVKFGYWFAYLPSGAHPSLTDYRHWISPTTGHLQRVPDLGVIDTSRPDRSWPVSLTEPESRFREAKTRAYWQLVEALLA